MLSALPDISVIVINWNGERFLDKCLAALRAQTCAPHQIILVDNGSSDRSLAIVGTKYPEVVVVPLNENTGFAGGANRGAAAATGEWLVFLNNDAFAEPDWLAHIADGIRRFPEYASFSSCQISDSDPGVLDGAGDIYHCSGMAWRRGNNQRVAEQWRTEAEIFGPCAAAGAYRASVFNACGGFDEDYFCYFEDVDLAFRMRLRGFRSGYLPLARVRHVGSGTKGRRSDFSRYYGHRNLVWTYLKNMPAGLFWRYLPFHLAFNMASLLLISVAGQPAVIFRAKRDAVLRIREVLAKRRAIQQQRVASAGDLRPWIDTTFRSLWTQMRHHR